MRWNKLFDGTKESLLNKSHKPLSKHPNAHTDKELKWIKDYMRRNPNITLSELYDKLRTDKVYSRHACSLFRVMRKLGYFINKEQSSYSPIDFVKRSIVYFGYKPKIIQTDNGGEFTHIKKTERIHPFDVLCNSLNIEHKLIRPRTPRHDGKVKWSHRNDQQRFYQFLKFYSYDDLLIQMKTYLKRSNNIPMQILNWKIPLEKRTELSKLNKNSTQQLIF